jgi:hypothetical protein
MKGIVTTQEETRKQEKEERQWRAISRRKRRT